MNDLSSRLEMIEARLAGIEKALGLTDEPTDLTVKNIDDELTFTFESLDDAQTLTQPVRGRLRAANRHTTLKASPSVTTLLGWAGAMALVLAAVYLVKLGVEAGWLTPAKRILGAAIGGVVLIGTGFFLKSRDRHYASLLPAGGVVVLFIAVYGAHLKYGMISGLMAAMMVGLICLLSLCFCRIFTTEIYALFAVTGSYTAPLLLKGLHHSVFDLAIYYSAWGLVFCSFALWIGQRRIYLLALYLALIGFDLIWRFGGHTDWQQAFLFQCVQLLIFALTTAYFSIRHKSPLDNNAAIIHLPALLIFYLLQYTLLDAHIPAWAPWIAVGSSLVIALVYLVARIRLRTELPGGKLLLSTYVALVLFHAGYLEVLPQQWAPWAALLAVVVLFGFIAARRDLLFVGWPVTLAIGVIFVINYLRVVADIDLHQVPGHDLLVAIYALQLYLGYWLAKRATLATEMTLSMIYAGHIAMLAAAAQWFDGRLAVSLSWGLLALLTLGVAIWKRDKVVGQSSLLVFAVCGFKVIFYDLADTAPLIRIACLLVAGVTFYMGGWLYRWVALLDIDNKNEE